jgi:capsule polysaccharide export protein KpsC/LpsZ
MGSYFDARQPSRLEAILNDPSFSLSPDEQQRAITLIERICADRITKYNKYVGIHSNLIVEEGAILVIDQKPTDASIEFAAAVEDTFDDMIHAAIAENPSARIYYKRHPDNIHNNNRQPVPPRLTLLPDNFDITTALDRCSTVYTVSSQVGFEALLRRKRVVVFGLPFYSGWGLTDDRQGLPRRTIKRTIEELFYVACIHLSVYLHPNKKILIELEEMFDCILEMRGATKSGRADNDPTPR